MSNEIGGLVAVMGSTFLYLAIILPTRPGASVSRLIEQRDADYGTRRVQAYARSGVRLWPIRHALRGVAGAWFPRMGPLR